MNNKQDFFKTQSCVLKVNIHCHGCKNKVRKILNKVDGVYSTSIDSEQGKVTVTGNVDPVVLIKKLEKNGKHAELWGLSKGGGNQNNQFMNQFMKNFNLDGGKIGKDNNDKAQKGGKDQAKGGQLQQHGHPQAQEQLQNLQFLQKLQQQQQMKGANMGSGKDQKTVKFNLPEDDFDDDDDDDDYDDDEDEFDDDELDDEIYGHRHHQSGKSIPIMGKDVKGGGGGGDKKGGNGGGGDKKGKEGGKKGGGGGGGGGGGMASVFKGMLGGGSGNTEKKDKEGKKDGKKGDKNKGGDGESGKNNGGFDGKFEKGGGFDGKGGKNGPNGGGKKSGNDDGFPLMGQMGQAAAGLRAMPIMGGGGGFNPGMAPGQSPNPGQYNSQQQQYMAMMMNQQRMNGGDGFGMMHQPMNASSMMYGRQPMGVGYGAPMVPPPGYHDPYTSYFSDENTESCSIM